MRFNFKLEVESKEITFEAERIYRSRQAERFKITIAGTGQLTIVQSDRPAIEAGKLNKAINWHKVEGHIVNAYTLQLIYQEIEQAVKELPPPFQGTLNF